MGKLLHVSGPNFISKFGPQAPLPPPLVTSATAMTFLSLALVPKASAGKSGLLHPITVRVPPPHGPGSHLWKAWRQHWYTSKLLLLRVVFRRDTQSTSAPRACTGSLRRESSWWAGPSPSLPSNLTQGLPERPEPQCLALDQGQLENQGSES